VTEPLKLSFRVACPPEHAFVIWTARTSLWWPADHSVSGEDGLEVVIEPFIGGRIFERTPSGREEEWGEVLAWEPPRRLVYLWHLRADRADATEVEIVFAPDGAEATEVRIDHRGWERLGDRGDAWRDRNRRGWETLWPWYVEYCERGGIDG
jgi:uncharacterized protein YndB with AHSA1/START domain